MVYTLNMQRGATKQRLISAIFDDDRDAFIAAKYSFYGEADVIRIEGQDFSGINLTDLPLDFVIFAHCVLRDCKISGLPIGLEKCDARDLDLRGQKVVLIAEDTDLSGCLFNQETILGEGPGINQSAFSRCKVGSDFKKHFSSQDVLFTDKDVLQLMLGEETLDEG